jgi:predicted nucleic acid-binding protein
LTVYFDSSALAKLVLRERGCEVVEELWGRAAHRVVNRLAYPEVRAGLAAAVRSRRIDHENLEEAAEDFDRLHATAHVLGIDDLLCLEAGDLAEEHALRGYDAVHLASALSIDAPQVVVATWDRELARAATACGCAAVPALSRGTTSA